MAALTTMSILGVFFIFAQLCCPCSARFNIEEKFVQSSKNITFKVKTQRYKKLPNTAINSSKVTWSFLRPVPSTVPKVIECGKTCQETMDCCGFFFNRSSTTGPNCFLNERPLRSEYLMHHDGIDLYEIKVSKHLSKLKLSMSDQYFSFYFTLSFLSCASTIHTEYYKKRLSWNNLLQL